MQIERDLVEINKLRESLGDEEADMELSRCQEEASSPSIALRILHDRVTARLAHWRGKRAEKLTEYESIMVGADNAFMALKITIAAIHHGNII